MVGHAAAGRAASGGIDMNIKALGLPLLLLAASAAHAQEDVGCPQLPADAGLAWEHRGTADSDFCRALREDGSEAFGLYIAKSSPFEARRANRREMASIDGREVQWYRAELVTQPDIEAREALIELPDGRVAHIWLQARSGEQLERMLDLAGELRFGKNHQVAGP